MVRAKNEPNSASMNISKPAQTQFSKRLAEVAQNARIKMPNSDRSNNSMKPQISHRSSRLGEDRREKEIVAVTY